MKKLRSKSKIEKFMSPFAYWAVLLFLFSSYRLVYVEFFQTFKQPFVIYTDEDIISELYTDFKEKYGEKKEENYHYGTNYLYGDYYYIFKTKDGLFAIKPIIDCMIEYEYKREDDWVGADPAVHYGDESYYFITPHSMNFKIGSNAVRYVGQEEITSTEIMQYAAKGKWLRNKYKKGEAINDEI